MSHTRNSELMGSFLKYCTEHPQERFWQALRNWCGWSYVIVSDTPPYIIDTEYNIEDTFSWEENEPQTL